MGGGSVRIWRPFTHDGLNDLQRISGSVSSAQYPVGLYYHLIPFETLLDGAILIFLQDNVSYHTPKPTQEWLQKEKVNILPLPSGNPDLNPIENLWGILCRKGYSNNNELEIAFIK
ncbi:hypothetical protein AVEN_271139-1 [Araneus ventricosus]|uniref:Tc1-like transposase DDE domain-containing protein n=1 Tax=Araneus ventricosus TaxID=182803 RepID=A0A4Y2E3Q6_ARAVE|nr:hypothetical protein AVEN_271139-1 [Araneus ventricosus]